MNRHLVLAAVALPTLFACASWKPAANAGRPSRRETIRSVLSQNVRVVVMNNGTAVRSASGVVIGKGANSEGAVSYVLTNAHVVSKREGESPKFVVLLDLPSGDSQEYAAKLVAQGVVPEADLAVLSMRGVEIEPATLGGEDELTVGDDVFVVAAPYGRALSVSGGIVSQIDFEKGSTRPSMIKTDAAIGYGASGGGLFSVESGKLIGIVEGYRTAKVSFPVAQETYSFDVPMPGETFAAPAAKVRHFLEVKGLGNLIGGHHGRVAASP